MRSIIHVDMDAFYAAIEQRDRPETRGLPVIIAHTGARGVVSTASYEARKFGVRSAMPTSQAQKLCPQGIYIEPNLAHYSAVSRDVFAVFARYTPEIEGLSLDEAFLDVSHSLSLFGSAEQIGQRIRADVFAATGLNCSVGLSHNKLLAKMASELCKPNGFLWLKPEAVHSTLDPLSVGRLYTIGKVSQAALEQLGIVSIGQLRTAKPVLVQKALGNQTHQVQAFAAGIDDRAVDSARADQSIGAEHTFATDLQQWSELQMWLMRLCERVASRLRQQKLQAGTITIKIRVPPFETCTRQCTIQASASTDTLFQHGTQLLKRWWDEQGKTSLADQATRQTSLADQATRQTRVRLLGVSASHLQAQSQGAHSAQLSLFAQDSKSDSQAKVRDALKDQISTRFGEAAMRRARTLAALKSDSSES
jgi:DNA polymerase IV